MLYKKDEELKRDYDYLLTPPSNEKLKKKIPKGQIILARIEKNKGNK